ncbi:MAG: sugar phosphate nucleotidyltransferase [bacterium]
MKAIIPVAGQGTRLRPHTHTVPKVLLQVAGKPIVGHILDQLEPLGIEELIMVVGYRGEMVQEYIRSRYSFKTKFVEQKELLGLGHAIYLAAEEAGPGPTLIILGDTIFRTDLRLVQNSEHALLGVKPVEDPRRFGIAEVKNGRIVRLVEKPDRPVSNLAIVGIYYLPDLAPLLECLKTIVQEKRTTKGELQLTDALQLLLDRGSDMRPLPVEGWLDCGKRETLLETNRQLLISKGYHRPLESSIVIEPVYVADSAVVEASIIGPFVSIADNSSIERSILRDTIVNQSATVRNASLEQSIVGDNAIVLGRMSHLNVGDSSEIDFT